MTLNPPGAPACVRCNTPLGGDPADGSKQIGPGLAAAPTGAPGSSRARAAAVQPPGYGIEEEPPPPPPPAPEPAGLARRVTVAGLAVVAIVLVAGAGALWLTRPRHLDTGSVQQTLSSELSTRTGTAVSVSCPGDQRQRSGVRFACIATDTTGGHQTVTVTVSDDSGRYTWQLGTA
ncbi:MAG TPA: DUF4333 domain-containing protein [Mycobacteriales bacterium]